MVARNVKLYVFDAHEESFTNKDNEVIKFNNCKIKGDDFDNYYKISCDKVVSDGWYNTAIRIQYDFEKKKDVIKLYVLDKVD